MSILNDVGTEMSQTDAAPSNNNGGQAATNEQVFTPPEWAKGLSVDQEILKAPMFQSVKTVDDIVKGYYHAQKMVGMDKAVLPTKNSSSEEWKAFYQKIGLPAKLEDYKTSVAESDPTFSAKIKELAFQHNVMPEQLDALYKAFEERDGSLVADYEKAQQEAVQQTAAELKKEWGEGAYQGQIMKAQRVVKEFMGEDGLNKILQSDLANNGDFLKLLAKIGDSLLTEDKFKGNTVHSFGMTKAEASKKINEIYGNTSHPYYNSMHAQHKDAVAEMLKLQEIMSQN